MPPTSRYGLSVLVIAMFVSAIPSVAADNPSPALADYRTMQQWRFGRPIPVPAGGITFNRDTATWSLESGNLYLMEPLADGTVTGLVFVGAGRFRMTIPDKFEVQQLRRFSGHDDVDGVDEAFTKLVLRSSAGLPLKLEAASPTGTFRRDSLARDRHEEWLKVRHMDVDARVFAGRLTPGDDFFLADMDTASFGWLMYEFEPDAQEEVRLIKLQPRNSFVETWVSLDRPEERDANGRPTSDRKRPIDISFVDLEIDLTKHTGSPVSFDREPLREPARFRATVAFLPLVEGPRALRLYLNPLAKVTKVTTGNGQPLDFVRDHIGGRFLALDNELYDGSLLVLLDESLHVNRTRQLVVEYEMRIYNYASGRDWYPGLEDDFDDPHTGKLTFKLPKKLEVRAVGTRDQQTSNENGTLSTWLVMRPVKMMGFSFGERFKEETIKVEGVPEVVSFGSPRGLVFGNMVRNVGVDVANSLHFYQWYFDVKLPIDRIYATCIAGYHGQAFDGFLHLSQLTYDAEHPGASELFRGHEVAHQIWGHLVGWKSYRDQWLSEAFAEYSAMLFIETTMTKETYFNEILDVYTAEQSGSLKQMLSKFARPWNIVLGERERRQVGPIAAGFRASTAQVPGAYFAQCYNKGALVLHMLRWFLRGAVRDRDLFREVMQEFVHTYAGKQAGTDDFKRLLEKKTGSDWTAFFDAWVYGTAVPSYRWSYAITPSPNGDGKFALKLTVKQSEVPAGFSMPVPVHFDLGNGKVGSVFVLVDRPEKTVTIELPTKPGKVIFNPGHAVLAKVKQE